MFLKYDFKLKRLDVFYRTFRNNEKKFDVLWSVCKMIMIFSHGQISIERGFSVNKEILQENLKEKTLVSE